MGLMLLLLVLTTSLTFENNLSDGTDVKVLGSSSSFSSSSSLKGIGNVSVHKYFGKILQLWEVFSPMKRVLMTVYVLMYPAVFRLIVGFWMSAMNICYEL